VRGFSSINGPKDPLVVLDNFPYTGNLNNINPADIESVTILKDAAAAAIWGTRAGNGVIVLTTKKAGMNRPLRLNYTSTFTMMDKPDLFYQPQMSTKDFIDMEVFLYEKGYYNIQINNSNKTGLSPVVELLIKKSAGQLSPEQVDKQLETLSTIDVRKEFIDKVYKPSLAFQNSISLTGGAANFDYYFSAGYDRNISSLDAGSERWTIRTQSSLTPLKNLQLDFCALITLAKTTTGKPDYRSINLSGSRKLYSYATLLSEEGAALPFYNLRQPYVDTAGGGRLLNWKYYPMDDYKYNRTDGKTTSNILNGSIRYTILPGLQADLSFQYENQLVNSRTLQDIQSYAARDMINRFTQLNRTNNTIKYIVPLGGILIDQYYKRNNYNGKARIDYNHRFFQGVLSAMAGVELIENNNDDNSYQLYGYNDELGTFANVDYVNSYPTFITGSNSFITNWNSLSGTVYRFRSVFFNGAYTYVNKYILSASARKDESNLFGVKANEKGVPLWSVGLAWNISNEPWFHLPLDYLKIRGSYGFSGNVDMNRSAVTTIRYSSSALYTNLPYAFISQYPNPSLRWEKVNTINLGLDFRSKEGRVGGSLDCYVKKGDDLFGLAPVDYTGGTNANYLIRNLAKMKGQGIDLELQVKPIDNQLKWEQVLNLNYSNNKVIDYYLTSQQGSPYLSSGSVITPVPGQPVYSIISYRWAGLEPSTGNPQGILDGQISTNYLGITGVKTTINDLVYSGSATPEVFGNFYNRISWRNWSAAANITYKLDYFFRRESINYITLANNGTGHADYYKRWQKPGDEVFTNIPSFVYPFITSRENFFNSSEALVTKGDHVRLQYVRLAYTKDMKKRQIGTNTLEISLNIMNPGLLWTANKLGIDPDYPGLVPPSPGFALGLQYNL
jgi:TonB-linked SusC/RagA family outer membrane protein